MKDKNLLVDLGKAAEEAGKQLAGFVIGLKNNAHSTPSGVLHEGPFHACPINCCVYARREAESPF